METMEMMKNANGDEVYSDMTIRCWHAEFLAGCESVALIPRSG